MDNSLRVLREQAGLSQGECASALGVSRQTVISIEKGHFDPRLSLAFRGLHAGRRVSTPGFPGCRPGRCRDWLGA